VTDWSVFYDDTRSDWNARPPTSTRTSVDISRRTEFFNHYIGPGSPNFMARPHADCLAKVREWQAYHQSKGWKDIGYNALVCGHARVVEGRGLGYSGSHCPDHNTSGFGVQFMVAGTERPTDAMYARMRRLYDDLVKAKGGPLAKRGHRDGVSTTCPGDIVYAWVKAGMPAPTTTEEDDMFSDTDRARLQALLDDADGAQLRKDIGYSRDQIRADVNALNAKVDALAAKPAAAVTHDELVAAFKDALGSLNDPPPVP
jgi:hypothetical protein